MSCSGCGSVMQYLGYFLWHCLFCGHRERGPLPERD